MAGETPIENRHPGVVGDEQIAGMGIGMEQVEIVDLMTVKIPESLSDLISLALRGITIGEFIERLAVDPFHGENVTGGEFGMICRKDDVQEMT